ncbi:MAG: hypothetical protein DDT32_01541 [Syntrophomonadaceae bacterium]|nr:hypothetical protein [Bacillota bacterium]
MKKRILGLGLSILVAALVVPGCPPVEVEVPVVEPVYTIRVVVHGGIADPFWLAVKKGAMDAAGLIPEVEVIFAGPTVFDFEEFMAFVEAAIVAEPDGLIVTITSYVALDEPLRRAIAAGIPVIAINAIDPRQVTDPPAMIPYLTYIGECHYSIGALVAKKMLEMLEEKGVEPKRALWGNHHPGAFHLEERAAGFIGVMEAAGIPAAQIDVTPCPVVGAELLIAYLKVNPETNMIQPAGTPFAETFIVRAIEEGLDPGEDIFVATIDLSPIVLDHIEAGKMLFTADQQQYLQGFLSVVHMYLHIKYGFMPPPLISTGEALVTAEMIPEVRELVEQGYR